MLLALFDLRSSAAKMAFCRVTGMTDSPEMTWSRGMTWNQ
jgi:hypothetical protein